MEICEFDVFLQGFWQAKLFRDLVRVVEKHKKWATQLFPKVTTTDFLGKKRIFTRKNELKRMSFFILFIDISQGFWMKISEYLFSRTLLSDYFCILKKGVLSFLIFNIVIRNGKIVRKHMLYYWYICLNFI